MVHPAVLGVLVHLLLERLRRFHPVGEILVVGNRGRHRAGDDLPGIGQHFLDRRRLILEGADGLILYRHGAGGGQGEGDRVIDRHDGGSLLLPISGCHLIIRFDVDQLDADTIPLVFQVGVIVVSLNLRRQRRQGGKRVRQHPLLAEGIP